ncbi:hypothetical protein N0V83_007433 [Neocucurbitaria cava]|uniref:SGNH hydrolase-type esterase domain-containing protein n=1 Tax=Neocucurbitaria cava TaxID=798079 RepID=A0A9W9CK01_9PLEO|nr:hypothetical protein N0V83_007433 [Neocucurbitaria cava]
MTCSGATSTDVLEQQIPALGKELDLLTISAAGNDVGLSPMLNSCVYQFYMSTENACNKSIAEAQAKIADEAQLYKNVTLLIEAAKPKMNQHHGVIYYTGYAGFFGTDDDLCDNVTWAVWRSLEHTKQYLTLSMRTELNSLVRSVNTILRKAVTASGPSVRFIDYDSRIEAMRGRYCESGVREPDPNRNGLAFYEWNTVDAGENKTELQNCTGGDVPKGSFQGDIGEKINRTLEEHPEWQFDPDKGFVNSTAEGEERQKGVIEDTIRWLLPDSYKRVFHLRPEGHNVVARMIIEDIEKYGPGGVVDMMEMEEL